MKRLEYLNRRGRCNRPLSDLESPSLHLALLLVVGMMGNSASVGGDSGFHPQDLGPDLFVESVATFTNPHSNSDCVGFEEPNYCCTGFDTGTCDNPVESFLVVDCTTRNIDCTGAGTPFACCTGAQSGTCCYEESDESHSFRGNSYCPASVCPDGCVNQWVEQSGYKSGQIGHPITGRTLEQDDLEKPCYKTNCLNGHACAVGHPKWLEPDYIANEDCVDVDNPQDCCTGPGSGKCQPEQDATMEIEPKDRTKPISECVGSFYVAQLIRIVPQPEDHYLLWGFSQYLVDENRLRFSPYSGATNLSIDNVLPELDAWYFIEVQRYPDNTMAVWVNEENVTRQQTPGSGTISPWSSLFCRGKTCDGDPVAGLQQSEFQGEGALLFYKCGATLNANEQTNLQDYVRKTFKYHSLSVMADDFESGNFSRWSWSETGA